MYDRILVPYDGSPPSERGLDEAIKLAKRLGSTIHLLHVNDLSLFIYAGLAPMPDDGTLIEGIHKAGQTLLQTAQAKVGAQGLKVEVTQIDTVAEPVAVAIVGQIRELQAGMVVMGTHGRRGWKRLALGSDAASVASLSPVPVVLVRVIEEPAT